jgi:hypothetical protein
MNNETMTAAIESKLGLTFKYDGGELHTIVLVKDLPALINAIVIGGGTIINVKA